MSCLHIIPYSRSNHSLNTIDTFSSLLLLPLTNTLSSEGKRNKELQNIFANPFLRGAYTIKELKGIERYLGGRCGLMLINSLQNLLT